MHGALASFELGGDVLVDVLVLIEGQDGVIIVGNVWLVLEVWRVAAVAHPDDVPVEAVRSVWAGFLFGQFQDCFGDLTRLFADLNRPVNVVFQHQSRSPAVLDDKLEHIDMC